MAEQVSLFAPDTWSGKTSREPLAPTRAKISQQSSKKRSVSSARKPPLCLCLKKDGLNLDAYTMTWEDGALLGEYTMHSFGESPRGENASLLSQILEDSPHPKYFLSEKACLGILTRAERRGKELPPELKAVLLAQSRSRSEEENLGGGKGILIQEERTGALSTLNNQSVLCLQGNMIDRDVKMNGIGVSEEPMYSLDTVDRHGVLCFKPRSPDGVPRICERGVTPALNTAQGGQRQQCVMAKGCYQNTGQGWWNESDVAATVRTACGGDSTKATLVTQCIDIKAVDVRNLNETEELSGTLQSKNNGGYSLNYQNPVRMGNCVRRLTPFECERLQGYPDKWTDIGEWVDSKGKKHKESSDSARYKALGNSIALPFWFYLLRRISAQYERPATLGSLFDGISGFPACWAKVNGPQSCLWSSEVEEFPIAVCRKYFGDEDSGMEGDYYEAILGRDKKKNV